MFVGKRKQTILKKCCFDITTYNVWQFLHAASSCLFSIAIFASIASLLLGVPITETAAAVAVLPLLYF